MSILGQAGEEDDTRTEEVSTKDVLLQSFPDFGRMGSILSDSTGYFV